MRFNYYPPVGEPHRCAICKKAGATHRDPKGDYIHILCDRKRTAKKIGVTLKEQRA